MCDPENDNFSDVQTVTDVMHLPLWRLQNFALFTLMERNQWREKYEFLLSKLACLEKEKEEVHRLVEHEIAVLRETKK